MPTTLADVRLAAHVAGIAVTDGPSSVAALNVRELLRGVRIEQFLTEVPLLTALQVAADNLRASPDCYRAASRAFTALNWRSDPWYRRWPRMWWWRCRHALQTRRPHTHVD